MQRRVIFRVNVSDERHFHGETRGDTAEGLCQSQVRVFIKKIVEVDAGIRVQVRVLPEDHIPEIGIAFRGEVNAACAIGVIKVIDVHAGLFFLFVVGRKGEKALKGLDVVKQDIVHGGFPLL